MVALMSECKIRQLILISIQATVDNGCMYVVPKQFDALFDSDQSFMHQQVCIAQQTA